MKDDRIKLGRLKTIPLENILTKTDLPAETVILAGDPLPDVTPEDIREEAAAARSVQELVDIYAAVHNKCGWIDDDLYDYEEGSAGYIEILTIVEAWGTLLRELEHRVTEVAEKEGLLIKDPGLGSIKQKELFMKAYGYRDGRGWWVRDDKDFSGSGKRTGDK